MTNNKKPFVPNITLCILLDIVGMASYLIPAIGEFADTVWGPYRVFYFLAFLVAGSV